jgi:hypothetical protein
MPAWSAKVLSEALTPLSSFVMTFDDIVYLSILKYEFWILKDSGQGEARGAACCAP